MIKRILITVLLSLPLFATAQTVIAEELAVIVSKNSPVDSLTDAEIQQLFSGQSRSVGGNSLQPLDLPGGDAQRNAFYQQLLGRSPDQMRSHWARLIFTGKARPPREVNSPREMKTMIESSESFIGYIPAADVNENVKVLKLLN